MKTCARLLLGLGVCVAFLLPTGCGDDDDGGGGNGDPTGLDVPQEWLGVWENTTTTTPCDLASAPALRETTVDTVLICPDAVNVFDDEELAALEDICTETVDGNTYRIVCDGTETIFGNCAVDIDADVTAVFSPTGDSYTFSGRYQAVASPGCAGVIADVCEDVSGSATRISTSTEGCDDGDDGGSGSTAVEVVVTGGSGVPSISFGQDEVFLTIAPEGEGWALAATNVPTDFTNFQAFAIVVPPDVEPGAAWSVGTPVTDNDIDIEFTDVRQGAAWELVDFDGLANITALTDTRLAGTLSGGGTLAGPDGESTESIDLDVTFDATIAAGAFDTGDRLREALRAMVRREAARRR